MPHFERPTIRRAVAFAFMIPQTSARRFVRVLSFQWRKRTAPLARWPWLLQWLGFKLKVVGSASTSPYRNPRNQRHIEGNQYLLKIQRAGGFKQYEAQVKKSLAAMLVPKFPQIPAEIIPTIVEFWAHAGDY